MRPLQKINSITNTKLCPICNSTKTTKNPREFFMLEELNKLQELGVKV